MDVLLGFIALLGLVLLAVGVILLLLRLIQKKPKGKAIFIAVTGVVLFLMVGFLSEPEESNTETAINDDENSSPSSEKDDREAELKDENSLTARSNENQQKRNSSPTMEEAIPVSMGEGQSKERKITPITKAEFNERFELDSEETQYENGKFIFKNGSTVTADYFQYKESDLFNYAMAIFEDGELASIQIESKDGINKSEVLEELGLQQKDIIIEQTEIGKKTGIYDIVINEKYKGGNVYRYPFELD